MGNPTKDFNYDRRLFKELLCKMFSLRELVKPDFLPPEKKTEVFRMDVVLLF